MLWAAATRPGTFESLIVGAGAATFPLHIDGLLETLVEAENLEQFQQADPARLINGSVDSIRNYDVPVDVRQDYVDSYAGGRFMDSIAYVRQYPESLARLASLLPSISTPVQIIVGADPYALDEDARILAGQIPHARLDVLATGHCAWEEAPREYAALVIDWIDRAHPKAAA